MNIYVARQPIFRKDRSLHGYELLFRDGLTNAFPDMDGSEATSRVLSGIFFAMGMDKVAGTGVVFINFTEELLVNRIPLMFPRDQVVVEVLEDVAPGDEVVEACVEIANEGYCIALDDFRYRPELARLIRPAKIIKFDLRATPLDTLSPLLEKLSPFGVDFLAEKVETHEEFREAVKRGFTYFQGYFFSRPEILEGRDISTPRLNLLEIMAEANRDDVSFDKLEKIIQRDVAISYKLLRYINSAYFHRISEITSIRQAIVRLGEKHIRRFFSLIAMATLASGKPDELIRESVVRARFCEELGGCGPCEISQDELFTLGLFSLIDAIMDDSMDALMERLPLSEEMKGALVRGEGRLGDYLELAKSYVRGHWEDVSMRAKGLGLDDDRLPECFLDSVAWADNLTSV